MALGFIWYAPFLFGKAWQKAQGWGNMSPAEIKKMQKEAMPAHLVGMIGAIVMAYVLAHVMGAMGVTDIPGALQTAFWMWLGFQATIGLTMTLYQRRPVVSFFIDGGMQLVYLMLAGMLLVSWM